MSENFKTDQVRTEDGSFTIRHPVYGEEFHSRHGARFESFQLYMIVSGFQARLDEKRPGTSIGLLDVGLGLGYNALMTLETWAASAGTEDLAMLSLEHTESLITALIDTDTAWKEGWSEDWRRWSASLERISQTCWKAEILHPTSGRRCFWTVELGDGQNANFEGFTFDFIWQDAFSPKKNPELWTPEWFAKIADSSQAGTCLVTYSVARMVRDNLEATAWTYEKIPAGGTKRQWLKALRP